MGTNGTLFRFFFIFLSFIVAVCQLFFFVFLIFPVAVCQLFFFFSFSDFYSICVSAILLLVPDILVAVKKCQKCSKCVG